MSFIPTPLFLTLTRLFFCCKSGSYRSYLVHEDLVVTERIDDIKPLGFYIRRLCDGKETYRMQRRSSLQGVDSLHASTQGRGVRGGHLGAKHSVVAFEKAEVVEELKRLYTGCETSLFAACLEY